MHAYGRNLVFMVLLALSSSLSHAQSGTGPYNTAVGAASLFNNTTGGGNTAIGYQALFDNTTGSANTGIGVNALFSNTEGHWNTAIGPNALYFNRTASWNTAIGSYALHSNTGAWNTALGGSALQTNTTGESNTAVGGQALLSNLTGRENTAVGVNSLYANRQGSWNAAFGSGALSSNTSGELNTAVGTSALRDNTTGISNTAVGAQAMICTTTGGDNTAVGRDALECNTGGSGNVAVGVRALLFNQAGSGNIAIGRYAGVYATGDFNIYIGNNGVGGESNTMRIGFQQEQSKVFVAGIRGTTTGLNDAVPVVLDSNGQLGTINSSRRFKEDIQDMGDGSRALLRLRPVTFRYTQRFADGEKPVQFGLIAEEVAEAMPELVVRDVDGRPETVKYQLLAPMLLNEFQKQQRTIEAQTERLAVQDAALESLSRQLADLQARLARLEQRP